MSENKNIFNKDFFYKSMIDNVLFNCSEILNKEEVNFLAKDVDWAFTPDSVIKYNEDLLSKLDWGLYIDRNRALRIAMSDISDGFELDAYPLHIYEYHFEEVVNSIKIFPELMGYLNIVSEIGFDDIIDIARVRPEILGMYEFKVDTLSQQQILDIVEIGGEEIIKNLDLDLSKLPIIDRFRAIKNSNYDYETMDKFGVFKEDFNHNYYVREILINTGDKYIDQINLNGLMPSDWVKILRQHRHLYVHVDLDDLIAYDIYHLVELCMFIPEFLPLINENNVHRLSSLGWEKLLIKHHEYDDGVFVKLCDFSKIEGRSWVEIGRERPELLIYRP